MNRKPIIVIVLAVIAAFGCFFALNSYSHAKIHPALRALKRPFRQSVAHYYFDGGSLGVTIVDRDGTICKVALPGNTREGYERIFIGDTYCRLLTTASTLDADTKHFLVEVIASSKAGDGRDIALESLHAHTSGHVAYYQRKLRGWFE